MRNLKTHRIAQNAARQVHEAIADFISPTETERSIAAFAKDKLVELGISETWYYKTPALVLLGSRSCLSVSGKDYEPSDELVGDENLVTVDLSPEIDGCWGDCARSFVVEDGRCTKRPTNHCMKEGLQLELELHESMKDFVTPSTSFSELYDFGNNLIEHSGFQNLDFLNNLGHSIEQSKSDRRFIDRSCHDKLGEVYYFTFEPHISKKNGKWGFKYENVYFFDIEGELQEL